MNNLKLEKLMAFIDKMIEVHEDLGNDVSSLCNICNEIRQDYIDIEGKFIWVNGEATFTFGKHSGRSLRHIADEYPDYLQWLFNADFRPDVNEIVEKAIKGEYPQTT